MVYKDFLLNTVHFQWCLLTNLEVNYVFVKKKNYSKYIDFIITIEVLF